MCGIFGILNHCARSSLDSNLLKMTATQLKHRGPDNQTVFHDNNTGFVHTRLALLDLSERGNQPFFSKDRSFCLVYNGEIYNFIDIREKLKTKGIIFRTTTDTEVLLEAILYYGISEALKMLDGMFAFAIWDFSKKTLLLVRDRFGIKPLFYYDQDNCFIFSSELSAIVLWIKAAANIPSIISYLQGFGGPTKGMTFLQNVRIANPGEIITVPQGGRACFKTAITIPELYDEEYSRNLSSFTRRQIVDKADELLFAAVKKQLMADVPVGALCSGGVDSSVIMAMATRLHSDLSIFHADVVGKDSELHAASMLAQYLNLDLKYVDTTDQDFVDLIPEIILHYSHPYAYHPNSVPFYKVSQLVRHNNIKAVLSGEGADECFIGYPWLIPSTKERVKDIFKQSLLYSFKHLISRLRGKLSGDGEAVACDGYLWLLEVRLDEINIEKIISSKSSKILNESDLISLRQLHYHLRTLLHRNDCLGMAAGIESRFPFLDLDVIKFAINLPYRYKVSFSPTFRHSRHDFMVDKWVLRTVASRYLPKKIAFRNKFGFPTNAQSRMKIPQKYFDDGFVRELYGLSQREFSDFYAYSSQGTRVKLMQTEVWAQLFINQVSVDQLVTGLQRHITYSQ
jgi:asparagine synthase (glutamine-hydrolysing)